LHEHRVWAGQDSNLRHEGQKPPAGDAGEPAGRAERAIHLRFRLLAGARLVASFSFSCGRDAAWMRPGGSDKGRALPFSRGPSLPVAVDVPTVRVGRANSDSHSGYFILKGALTIDRLANRPFVGQSAAPVARSAARTGARDLRGLSAYAGPARRARGPLAGRQQRSHASFAKRALARQRLQHRSGSRDGRRRRRNGRRPRSPRRYAIPSARAPARGRVHPGSLRLRRRHDRGSRACEDEHASVAFAVDELPALTAQASPRICASRSKSAA